MKKQFPSSQRRKQRTAQQTLKRFHWSQGQLDVGEYKTAPEQFPTSPRERTEHDQTRPRDFGWVNGQI
jgi:hypothetical protein